MPLPPLAPGFPTTLSEPIYGSSTAISTQTFIPQPNSLIMVAAVAQDSTAGSSPPGLSITDSLGLTWGTVAGVQGPAAGYAGVTAQLWWALAPATPQGMTVTVHPAVATTGLVVQACQITGVSTVTPTGQQASNGSPNSIPSTTLGATPNVRSLVVSVIGQAGGSTEPTEPTGWAYVFPFQGYAGVYMSVAAGNAFIGASTIGWSGGTAGVTTAVAGVEVLLGFPSLANYQAQMNGLVIGAGTNFGIKEIDGFLGFPGTRSADVPLARDSGEWIGLDLYSGRDITLTSLLQADSISLQHAQESYSTMLNTAGTQKGAVTETPFYLQLPNLPLLCSSVRTRQLSYAVDINFMAGLTGGEDGFSALLHATDPRLYTTGTGYFGFDGTGHAMVTNGGNIEVRPIIVVLGPSTNPAVTNLNINRTVGFTMSVAAGDALVIDLGARTAVLASTGASQLGNITAGFTWWNLPPGGNSVLLNSGNGFVYAVSGWML